MAAQDEKKRFFTKPLLIIFVTVLIDLIGFGIVVWATTPRWPANTGA